MNIESLMEQMDAARLSGHMGLRVKEILAVLDAAPDDVSVGFDFEYMKPNGIGSYRGYYSDLAIGFDNDYRRPDVKNEEFRQELRDCIGQTFTGYKGGDFTMTEDTPVWVANNGNSGGTAVIRVTYNDWSVTLHTAKIDD